MSLLLRSSELRFAYDRQPVLRGVGVELSAGQVLTLIGPNGSGKSTLIKLLLGQLHPSAGSVLWEGRPLQRWSRRQLARTVAYLPQSPTWDGQQRVVDVLRLGRAPYWSAFGLESQRDVQVVQEVAAMLGLEELLSRPMDELSGGQRQTVFVGRCLAQEPRAMLLDEPNTFLDLKHQVDLCRLLRRLAAERGIGVLMASHDLNLAAALADGLVLLEGGQIAAAGTPEQVLQGEILSRVYGLPIQRIDRPGAAAPAVMPVV